MTRRVSGPLADTYNSELRKIFNDNPSADLERKTGDPRRVVSDPISRPVVMESTDDEDGKLSFLIARYYIDLTR